MDGPLEVALVVLRRGDAVLLQRRDRAPFAGRWELPGGKVRPGEAADLAAVREAQEELGVEVREPRALGVHEHRYPQGPWVRLHAFEARAPAIAETPDRRWVPLRDLGAMPLLEGTLPFLAALRTATP